MTTNVGAEMIKRQGSLGFSLKRDEITEEKLAYEEMRKKLVESLRRVFRPEFINRLDSVIVFRSLNREDIQQIVQLELNKVAERLKDHSIALTATSAALDKLAELGYDPEMGARPLRRVIQQKVEDPLSDALLCGEFEDGNNIEVVLADDEVVLRRIQPEETTPTLEEPAPAA
jgi:ATP-dependent Clp protease ATP-binding subunit ClpC